MSEWGCQVFFFNFNGLMRCVHVVPGCLNDKLWFSVRIGMKIPRLRSLFWHFSVLTLLARFILAIWLSGYLAIWLSGYLAIWLDCVHCQLKRPTWRISLQACDYSITREVWFRNGCIVGHYIQTTRRPQNKELIELRDQTLSMNTSISRVGTIQSKLSHSLYRVS